MPLRFAPKLFPIRGTLHYGFARRLLLVAVHAKGLQVRRSMIVAAINVIDLIGGRPALHAPVTIPAKNGLSERVPIGRKFRFASTFTLPHCTPPKVSPLPGACGTRLPRYPEARVAMRPPLAVLHQDPRYALRVNSRGERAGTRSTVQPRYPQQRCDVQLSTLLTRYMLLSKEVRWLDE